VLPNGIVAENSGNHGTRNWNSSSPPPARRTSQQRWRKVRSRHIAVSPCLGHGIGLDRCHRGAGGGVEGAAARSGFRRPCQGYVRPEQAASVHEPKGKQQHRRENPAIFNGHRSSVVSRVQQFSTARHHLLDPDDRLRVKCGGDAPTCRKDDRVVERRVDLDIKASRAARTGGSGTFRGGRPKV
jgi:hypothetical protein